jgi:hypothetical protein
MDYLIRRAVPGDAEEMVAVLRSIVAEKVYTAIDRPWPVEGQRSYLSSLSTREAVHVAEQVCDSGTEQQSGSAKLLQANGFLRVRKAGQAGENRRAGRRRGFIRTVLVRETACLSLQSPSLTFLESKFESKLHDSHWIAKTPNLAHAGSVRRELIRIAEADSTGIAKERRVCGIDGFCTELEIEPFL